jgi:hypothetical protein
MTTLCSRCAAVMTCKPEGECWCMNLPPALPLPSSGYDKCLCRKCLTDDIKLLSDQAGNFETLPEGR